MMKPDEWMCARCGKVNTPAYKKCVLCRRPKNAPKGWDIPQHDEGKRK